LLELANYNNKNEKVKYYLLQLCSFAACNWCRSWFQRNWRAAYSRWNGNISPLCKDI